ncbi:MAG: response regulator [Spirulinaceae cyanobacterium]
MELLDSLILVVDDLIQNLQVIGNLLENKGYDTTFATSGKQALERIKISKPDLILLDLMMPEMSGLEVCKILKSESQWQDIPIIFLTANRNPQSLIEAFAAGAADYITKPFQPEEILARINNQLTQITLRRQLQSQNQQLQAEIAQRHQIEQALAQAKQTAEMANQAKSTFLANMSHELRSPLNAILGFTQLLRHGKNLTPDQQENVNVIYRSGRHLLDLINDILDLSKIEAGRVQLHWETVDLLELLAEIQEMLSLKAKDKGLILRFEIGNNVPRSLVSDRLRLRQILINLIGNAIKFTEKGSIVLTVNVAENGETPPMSPAVCVLLWGIQESALRPTNFPYFFNPLARPHRGLVRPKGRD